MVGRKKEDAVPVVNVATTAAAATFEHDLEELRRVLFRVLDMFGV